MARTAAAKKAPEVKIEVAEASSPEVEVDVPQPPAYKAKSKKSKGVVKKSPEPECATPAPVEGVVKKKRTRAPTDYNAFVKLHMAKPEIKALPANARFRAVADLYKATKAVKA